MLPVKNYFLFTLKRTPIMFVAVFIWDGWDSRGINSKRLRMLSLRLAVAYLLARLVLTIWIIIYACFAMKRTLALDRVPALFV